MQTSLLPQNATPPSIHVIVRGNWTRNPPSWFSLHPEISLLQGHPPGIVARQMSTYFSLFREVDDAISKPLTKNFMFKNY